MLFKSISDHLPRVNNFKNVIIFQMGHMDPKLGDLEGHRLIFRLYRGKKKSQIFLKRVAYCLSSYRNKQYALPPMSLHMFLNQNVTGHH